MCPNVGQLVQLRRFVRRLSAKLHFHCVFCGLFESLVLRLFWPIKTREIDSSPKIFTGSVSYSCTLGACEFRTPFVLLALSAAHWLQCPGIVAALKRVVR